MLHSFINSFYLISIHSKDMSNFIQSPHSDESVTIHWKLIFREGFTKQSSLLFFARHRTFGAQTGNYSSLSVARPMTLSSWPVIHHGGQHSLRRGKVARGVKASSVRRVSLHTMGTARAGHWRRSWRVFLATARMLFTQCACTKSLSQPRDAIQDLGSWLES